MPVLDKLNCYIDGQFVDSPVYFDNIDPVNGQVFGKIAEADQEQINQAVKSARQAQKGEWQKYTINQRCDLLHKVADRIIDRQQEFIEAEIADTGKSLQQVQTIDIPRGSANFKTFADMARNHNGETFLLKRQMAIKHLITASINRSVLLPLFLLGTYLYY